MPSFDFDITFPVRVTVPEGTSKDEVISSTQAQFAEGEGGRFGFARNLVVHGLKFLVKAACGVGEVKVRLGRGERIPVVSG